MQLRQSRNRHYIEWKCLGFSPPSVSSLSCTLTTWWRSKLMDLPIFHGQHSINKQIQMKRTSYRDVRLCRSESNNVEKWALTVETKGVIYQPLVPDSLYSRQHHVTPPNEASQRCWAQNKSAARANNNAGLSFQQRTPGGTQEMRLWEQSVAELCIRGQLWPQQPGVNSKRFCIEGFCAQFVLNTASEYLVVLEFLYLPHLYCTTAHATPAALFLQYKRSVSSVQ